MNDHWKRLSISFVLACLTTAIYWPLTHSSFINLDDHQYVTDNPHVLGGISWDNFLWAFTTPHASNWHPITWLSHQLDVQLFGLTPGAHHLVNLVFHVANSVLLFYLLTRTTRLIWPSALVAALFALHPLHVESVAWVSERKDVLSTFFFFLMALAYTRYVEHRKKSFIERDKPSLSVGLIYYFLSCLAYALGLMSKPMLVTAPFVLLLLDFWPLERWKTSGAGERSAKNRALWLVFEKTPYFLLSIVCSVVTFRVQQQNHAVVSDVALSWRLSNAVLSYSKYLAKTFWPVKLSIFYPRPELDSIAGQPWQGAALWSVLLLLTVSIIAVSTWKRRPWFATGWFWYLGTLVPVIGIVQVGSQAMADRYTYIPLIGIFIILVWLAVETINRWQSVAPLKSGSAGTNATRPGSLRPAFATLAGIFLVAGYSVATRAQLVHWENNLTLFEHALRVTGPNAVAHFNLGADYALRRDFEMAIPHLKAALEDDPSLSDAHIGLAAILAQQGRFQEAMEHYHAALKTRPWSAIAHNGLGSLLMHEGKRDQAIKEYSEAARLAPDFPNAHNNLGLALSADGKLEEAVQQFRIAIQLDPRNELAHFSLATILNRQGDLNAAMAEYSATMRLNPTNTLALNNMAWIKATAADAKFRDANEAVRLASSACKLSDFREPQFIGTLAAAYAEARQFDDAITSATKARDLAAERGNKILSARNEELLELYRAGKPFRAEK